MRENEIATLSYNFALKITQLHKFLKERKMNYGPGDQVFRSGTSIAANIAESEFAQSSADFVSKLSISLKEAGETRMWIRLLRDSGYVSNERAEELLDDCNRIIRILITIIKKIKEKNQD